MNSKIYYLIVLLCVGTIAFACENCSNFSSNVDSSINGTKQTKVSDDTLRCVKNDSILLTTENNNFSTPIDSAYFTIWNNSSTNIVADKYYKIERMTCDGWEQCRAKYDAVIDDIGIIIKPEGNYRFLIHLSNTVGNYTDGEFRISKKIKIEGVSQQLYCIFYINKKV